MIVVERCCYGHGGGVGESGETPSCDTRHARLKMQMQLFLVQQPTISALYFNSPGPEVQTASSFIFVRLLEEGGIFRASPEADRESPPIDASQR